MDKLKRVLSGRDAEEPSGLSEVTLRSPGTCRPSGRGEPHAGDRAVVAERRVAAAQWPVEKEAAEGGDPGPPPERHRGPSARLGRRRDRPAPPQPVVGPPAPRGGAGRGYRGRSSAGAGLRTFTCA